MGYPFKLAPHNFYPSLRNYEDANPFTESVEDILEDSWEAILEIRNTSELLCPNCDESSSEPVCPICCTPIRFE